MTTAAETGAVLFYDGVCALCNRIVAFIVKRDRRDRFRFAPLQSNLARETLARHGLDASALDTMFMVTGLGTPEERVAGKSRAVLAFCARLGFPWSLAGALRLVPARLLDGLYDRVARNRYATFGRLDACPVPPPEERHKFLGFGD
jgi:predicted DCC family thiol-disulfide oxidoreductase YuxK